MFYYALIFVLEVTKAGQPIVLFVNRFDNPTQCWNAVDKAREKMNEDEKKCASCILMIDESKLRET